MKKSKLLSLLLAVLMVVGVFAGCQTQAKQQETPLVVGYSDFSGRFSPFFAQTAYDMDVSDMTQIGLVSYDRTGAIVYNGIKGETRSYEGTDYTYKTATDITVDFDEAANKTVYTFKLRDGMKFSDGEAVTADDIIFSFYTLCDPTYTGSSTVYSLPIPGMNEYRYQANSAMQEKYSKLFEAIWAAGPAEVAEGATQEMVDSVFTFATNEWWTIETQSIVDYCVGNYMDYAVGMTGMTKEELSADNMHVMVGMILWGFAEYDAESGVLAGAVTGATWDVAAGAVPVIADYVTEAQAAYENNPAAFFDVETTGETVDVKNTSITKFIQEFSGKDPQAGQASYPNITGIKKLDKLTVEITVDGFDAAAIYRLGFQVSPLHYYGDKAKYDYDNNKFGFEFGDLSKQSSLLSKPMGAGAYKFVKYENRVVYFEANDYYWEGRPIIKNLQFKETNEADRISGVVNGVIDVTDPSFSKEAVAEIKKANANGELNGDVIEVSTVDNLGYGYIGICADTVNVGGVKDSEASKNLRRAFATILSVYREIAVDSYYGERASVINYPISNTSWAAPRTSDQGYKVAFSVNKDGADLYTSDMNSDAKFAAAQKAAYDFLIAAGYTGDGTKVTAAPAGAKVDYELIIPGDGKGDHPSFLLVTMAKDSLAQIGITLNINDPADSNALWDKVNAGTAEIWCAAWGATLDPDMYQVYHSDNASQSNHYRIADAELDRLIIDARKSEDQAFRRTTYKAALDVIIDWAVEVPIYQRQNAIIFSAQRMDLSTLTPDITTYWGWMGDLSTMKMIEK